MKKIMTLLFLSLVIHTNIASSSPTLPDGIGIREHWLSLTKSYDIETRTQKLGTLYQRFFSWMLTYDYYDPWDVMTATAKARFFSFSAHLDIYDQYDNFIGGVEEKIFTFFPTFEIFARDSSTILATAKMNFWGTEFYIYDPQTQQQMAVMHRSFFSLKNDWDIQVTNRALLDQKNIDSRVFLTVLAVQGEIEDWQLRNQSNSSIRAQTMQSQSSSSLDILYKQIALNKKGLEKSEEFSQDQLEALAAELDQQFNAENQAENLNQSNEEQMRVFTSYCINLLNSADLSETKKQAILTLLNLRLNSRK